MKLNDYILTSNTGLDAIQRAPIVNEKTGIKCLRIQDISQNKSYNDWGNTKVSKENYDAFKLLKNDLIIARTGSTVGINMIIKNDLKSVYNNGLIRLRTNHNAIPYYIYLVMQTNKFKSYINNIACGSSTQPNLRIADLLNYDFKAHNINKQQHIVDIISFVLKCL